MNPRTLVMYHGGCNDGFGGAYAAWKKFGDSVEFIPLHRGEELPEIVDGADVFLIDFTYTREIMDELLSRVASLVVLDHHEGIRDAIEAMPVHVFDANRSGATIAWNYFHPDLPIPKLLTHIEDDDLFKFLLPDTKPLITYIDLQERTFVAWDEIARKLDDADELSEILNKASAYREYFEKLAEISVDKANLVSFEGYEIYYATTHPLKTMKSLVGNLLARKKGPFGLVVAAHPNGYGVSIRGDGSVNVAHIAQKFGGNGHPNSAGFLIPREGPFPWELVTEDADTSH